MPAEDITIAISWINRNPGELFEEIWPVQYTRYWQRHGCKCDCIKEVHLEEAYGSLLLLSISCDGWIMAKLQKIFLYMYSKSPKRMGVIEECKREGIFSLIHDNRKLTEYVFYCMRCRRAASWRLV